MTTINVFPTSRPNINMAIMILIVKFQLAVGIYHIEDVCPCCFSYVSSHPAGASLQCRPIPEGRASGIRDRHILSPPGGGAQGIRYRVQILSHPHRQSPITISSCARRRSCGSSAVGGALGTWRWSGPVIFGLISEHSFVHFVCSLQEPLLRCCPAGGGSA
jgi:hypothetical protein